MCWLCRRKRCGLWSWGFSRFIWGHFFSSAFVSILCTSMLMCVCPPLWWAGQDMSTLWSQKEMAWQCSYWPEDWQCVLHMVWPCAGPPWLESHLQCHCPGDSTATWLSLSAMFSSIPPTKGPNSPCSVLLVTATLSVPSWDILSSSDGHLLCVCVRACVRVHACVFVCFLALGTVCSLSLSASTSSLPTAFLLYWSFSIRTLPHSSVWRTGWFWVRKLLGV